MELSLLVWAVLLLLYLQFFCRSYLVRKSINKIRYRISKLEVELENNKTFFLTMEKVNQDKFDQISNHIKDIRDTLGLYRRI